MALCGCANQIALSQAKSKRRPTPVTIQTPPAGKDYATFAGGCFWCTEAIFTELKGVDKVESGYAGGSTPSPSYDDVCSGNTGHAESVRVTFDPKVISYHDLLSIFFATHDPTTLNQQGADRGTQYRSDIFYSSPEQKKIAFQVIKEVTDQKIYSRPIVTGVTAFTNYYPAEDYHKDYYARNGRQPYCQAVIAPKVAKFRQHFREKLKK